MSLWLLHRSYRKLRAPCKLMSWVKCLILPSSLPFLHSPFSCRLHHSCHPRWWNVGWEIFRKGRESNGGPLSDKLRVRVKRQSQRKRRWIYKEIKHEREEVQNKAQKKKTWDVRKESGRNVCNDTKLKSSQAWCHFVSYKEVENRDDHCTQRCTIASVQCLFPQKYLIFFIRCSILEQKLSGWWPSLKHLECTVVFMSNHGQVTNTLQIYFSICY